MIFAINPPCKSEQWEGLPNRCHPFLSPLTSYSASRVRKVSFKRISSDQFRLLQTGSMDVSRDQEHDRTHLRDLLTCSARSPASPVRGSESVGVFRPPKIPKEGLGTSFTAIQRYAIPKTSQACLKHTQAHPNPLPASPTASRNAEADCP